MPDKTTVLRWRADEENTQFRTQYAYARDMQADALFDEALEIADETSADWTKTGRDADKRDLIWRDPWGREEFGQRS